MKNVPCRHVKQKGHCRKCRPNNFCRHKVHRSHCRTCNPLGWASGLLASAQNAARRRKHVKPNIEPNILVSIMQSSKICAGCGGLLDWKKKPYPHLHHDHKTGFVFGFCHQLCNQAEGMLSRLTIEQRKTFIQNFFPEVLK